MQEADNDALKKIEDTAKAAIEPVKQLATDCEERTESCIQRSEALYQLELCFNIFCLKRELCDAGGRNGGSEEH